MECIIIASDLTTRQQLNRIVRSFGFEPIVIEQRRQLFAYRRHRFEALVVVEDECKATRELVEYFDGELCPSIYRPRAMMLLPADAPFDEQSMLKLFLDTDKFEVVPEERVPLEPIPAHLTLEAAE